MWVRDTGHIRFNDRISCGLIKKIMRFYRMKKMNFHIDFLLLVMKYHRGGVMFDTLLNLLSFSLTFCHGFEHISEIAFYLK